jgi:hypothetical protein
VTSLLTALSALALVVGDGASIRTHEVSLVDTDVVTKTFEVLDVHAGGGLVLFRHVYTMVGDPSRNLAAGAECRYPGLGANEGEVFGIYDLAVDDVVVVFPTMAPARQTSECSSEEDTARARRDLARFLDDKGLSSRGKEARVLPLRPGGVSDVRVGDRRLRLRQSSSLCTERDVERDPVLTGATPGTVLVARVFDGAEILNTRYHDVGDLDPRTATLAFTGLVVVDQERAVLVERLTATSPTGVPFAAVSFSALPTTGGEPAPRAALPRADDDSDQSDRGDSGRSGCSPLCDVGACACLAPLIATGCGCFLCGSLFTDDDDDDKGAPKQPEQPPKEKPLPPERYTRSTLGS